MRKLFLALIMCFTFVTISAQPPKGITTLSGDYSCFVEKGSKATHSGFFGIEHFVKDGLSLGIGVSYVDYWRYGIQVNYFIPLYESPVYFSLLNYISIGKEPGNDCIGQADRWRPSISITPAFNYDMSDHWTVYASFANLEVGFNSPYCAFNLNTPRLGFLFSF